MDVIVEENAAGILFGTERWYLFLDGITGLRRFSDNTWTIQHYNGTTFLIDASAISEDQIDYLKAAMERGRTPDGFRAVVDRGKRIEEIMRSAQSVNSAPIRRRLAISWLHSAPIPRHPYNTQD